MKRVLSLILCFFLVLPGLISGLMISVNAANFVDEGIVEGLIQQNSRSTQSYKVIGSGYNYTSNTAGYYWYQWEGHKYDMATSSATLYRYAVGDLASYEATLGVSLDKQGSYSLSPNSSAAYARFVLLCLDAKENVIGYLYIDKVISNLDDDSVLYYTFNGLDLFSGTVYVLPRIYVFSARSSVSTVLARSASLPDISYGISAQYWDIDFFVRTSGSTGECYTRNIDEYRYLWGEPTLPLVTTSFNGQAIGIGSQEVVNLFVHVENVNGTPTVEWMCQPVGTGVSEPVSLGIYTFDKAADGSYYGAWQYTPDIEAAPYSIAIWSVVYNTIGSYSQSIQTNSCYINVDGGIPEPTDVTEVTEPSQGETGDQIGDLTQIETTLDEVQTELGLVSDKLDNLSDSVDQLPDKITDGFSSVLDEKEEAAQGTGSDKANEVIDIIPDHSAGFTTALSSLVDTLHYDGTACVLEVPAVVVPSVNNLFPEFQLMAAQSIDFEEYIALFPDKLLSIVRALFDIAIVGYCMKEFMELLAGFANGFKSAALDDERSSRR